MDFRDYWYCSLPKEKRPAFAAACKTTVGYLNLVASGHARPGETLCLHIERESEGVVPVEKLRPDVPWEVVRDRPAPIEVLTPPDEAAA